MKSEIIENRIILECQCGAIKHLFVVDYFDDFNNIQISFMYTKHSLWERIKYSLNYLFKKEDLYVADIIIDDIKPFENLISEIKMKRINKKDDH